MKLSKTIEEINAKIKLGTAVVVRADEMTKIVRDRGPARAAEEVDVVTTGTFGAMCSSGVWLNFGHSDPPIKIARLRLNDVEAYSGVAAVDAYLGAAQRSRGRGIEYGGAHVIEELLQGKSVLLRAVAYGTDCYPRKKIIGRFTLADLNSALLSNPRNAYQRYAAATNSTDRTLHTYMGKLLPHCGNATFSGAGELSPLANDPRLATIGIGTRIFLGGGQGHVTAAGTQHNPQNNFSTLMVQGDLKKMSPEFIRAASFPGYGSTLYVGIGVPIPILDERIAADAGVADADISTEVLDYGVASRDRPVLRTTNYAELKSGKLTLDGRETPAAPLSSFSKAKKIAEKLRQWIERGEFELSTPVEPLSRTATVEPMRLKPAGSERGKSILSGNGLSKNGIPSPKNGAVSDFFALPPTETVAWSEAKCVQCGQCLSLCPRGVFHRDDEWRIRADTAKCRPCGRCANACPTRAITPPRGGKND
ncbi:MAG: 4Fe-4S binding protein [Pirellulaceae bacterium]|nr:4Fe-4S binding protein [Pirellulaceae bacterium]